MAVASALPAYAATPENQAMQHDGVAIKKVTFHNNNGTDLVGNVHLPKGFDPGKRYPAIITVAPAGGVKEQTAGVYARKMAEKGFFTIAYDASFIGESGGMPRYKEDPYARTEDVRGAVDYLVTLPYADDAKIGVLGICAGGSYAVSAAMTERRIKAVGLSVPVDGGAEQRAAGKEATFETLNAAAEQRTKEARGGEAMLIQWIPDENKDGNDIDLREGYKYYRTERGATPNWPNKMRFSSMDAVMGFDAYNLADVLLTQPLEVIVGSEQGAYGSNKSGHEIYRRAASVSKDLQVLDGASHFDLYDNPKYVDKAVATFDEFFHRSMK